MGAYPTLSMNPEFPLDVDVYKPQVRTQFEDGVVQSRARATKARDIFRLVYRSLPEADKVLLKTHFEANVGGTFSWTNPQDSVTYTVRYKDDKLPLRTIAYKLWHADFILEEA